MASRGKTIQKSHMFVADFETCDSDELSESVIKNDDGEDEQVYQQRVWLGGFKNLETMRSTYHNSLDGFMSDILSRGDNQNKEIGFHNLKFDGTFIVPWLLNNGYESTIDKPGAKEFSVLVTDRNDWYAITIQVTKRRRVRLWDTAKLFPAKLEYLPQIYFTPTQKVQEPQSFYEEKRPIGHQATERELRYFENDLQVLAETLNAHIEHVGIRFRKTQAGQAFYDFEQSFKAWKLRFPALDTELDQELRSAYWGGISYVPPHYAGKTLKKIKAMDINSSYPDKAANNKLPYGECLFEWQDKHPDMSKFWIADVVMEFKLKPYHLPCIPKKAITEGLTPDTEAPDKWLADSGGIVRLKFSSIDYMAMRESYDITIKKWVNVWHWKQRVHPEIAEFVNRNNTIKVESKKKAKTLKVSAEKFNLLAKAQRAKTTNNSFYGKFGEEVIKEGKTPYLDEETGGVTWEVDKVQELTDGKKKYLPVAIAITAYGRQQLVRLANALGESFLYCDTDSVHFLDEPGTPIVEELEKTGELIIDSTQLGAWDIEGTFEKGRYLRPKCYLEGDDEEQEATVAGLPADPHTGQFSKSRSCLTWDNFEIGLTIPKDKANKLRTVRTETGAKLVSTHFTITKHANFLYN